MGAPVNGFEKPAPDGQQLQLASSKRNPQSGAASQHCSAVKSGHGAQLAHVQGRRASRGAFSSRERMIRRSSSDPGASRESPAALEIRCWH